MILQCSGHPRELESTTSEASATLGERCVGCPELKDGTSNAVVLEELPSGCQQLTLHFAACVKMKLDDGMMVQDDWQNLVTKAKF